MRKAPVATGCVVAVLDTGLATKGPATIARATSKNSKAPQVGTFNVWTRDAAIDDDLLDEMGDNFLDPFSGHGTFIAGLINEIAPGCSIVSHKVLRSYGDVDDAELALGISTLLMRLGRLDPDTRWASPPIAAALIKAVANGAAPFVLADFVSSFKATVPAATKLDTWAAKPLVINLSVSGYSEKDDLPICTAEIIRNLLVPAGKRKADVAIVAAAGNNASCRPTWPAALEGVISVGALDGSGPAWYTNYGPWVRACAQGTEVINAFWDNDPTVARAFDSDLDDFGGAAIWSGTSFAAPIVAAAIAHEVVTAGLSPQFAEERTVSNPRLVRLPGLGTIINIV